MSKVCIKMNGVWNECEAVMENGVLKIVKATPITPEKEYDDFMSSSSEMQEIIFNHSLDNYCMMGTPLPKFITRICREKGINFRALKKAYTKNKTLTRFKFK